MKTQKLNLSLDDFDSCAGNTFKDLLGQSDFTDVTLVSDDLQQIKAHKVILSYSSSKFKALLQNSGKQELFIYLTGVSYSEMQSMINFIYSGQTEISEEDLEHFLQIAAKFDVKGLTGYKLQDDIEPEPKPEPSIAENPEPRIDETSPFKIVEKDYEFKQEINESKPETRVSKAKVADGEMPMLYCEGCDYKTTRPYTLNLHKKAIHEGVKHPCDQCEATFSFKHSVKIHKKSKHSTGL